MSVRPSHLNERLAGLLRKQRPNIRQLLAAGKYKLRKRNYCIESYLAGRWLRRQVKVMVVGGM